jgi:hypothetical protein
MIKLAFEFSYQLSAFSLQQIMQRLNSSTQQEKLEADS